MRPSFEATSVAAADQSRSDRGDGERLSNSQRLIYTGQRLAPDSALYNMVLCFRIRGPLDADRFVAAFETLLRSNAVLRGVVREPADDHSGGQPVEQQGGPRWYTLPLAAASAVDATAQVEVLQLDSAATTDWVQQQRQRRFDLGHSLYHCALIDHGDQQWTWYLNLHHLITDGMATELIFQRMSALYEAAAEVDADAALPQFPDYADYRRYEQAFADTPEYRAASEFWQQRLQQPLQRSGFYGAAAASGAVAGAVAGKASAMSAAAERSSGRSQRVVCALGGERSERLLVLAQQPAFRGLTPDMGRFLLLATLLVCYLHRIGGARTIRLGVPFHNRPTPEFKQTLGLFMEICPLQVEVDADDSFASLAAKLRTELMTVVRHARAGVSSAASNRAYDVLLNYVNIRFGDFAGLPVEIEWVHAGYGDSNHSLRLQVHDFAAADRLELLFDFNCALFDDSRQQRAIEHFLRVCDVCIDDHQRPLGSFALISAAQQAALVGDFQPPAIAAGLAGTTSVLALIDRQADRHPAAIAVADEQQALDYRELMSRVDTVAQALAARGIGIGDFVGVLLPRSSDAVVAILGVLRCGAAFVPLDPEYPDARIIELATDFGPADGAWIISDAQRPMPVGAGRELALVELLSQGGQAPSLHQIEPAQRSAGPQMPAADQPAYVIYTSGSSGRPKGVVVSHGALLNYVAWAGPHYSDGRPAAFPLYSSLCFDQYLSVILVLPTDSFSINTSST